MAESDSFFALQTAVAGRYSLVRELGRGGMGIVYLARDVTLDRPVAIKMLPPSLAEDAQFRERFLREARTVARLSHPNIVPIHAVEEHDGLVFFVMSYIDGETLGARVRRAGPLASSDATRVLQEMAWALAHAHARDVVHRDVKPDNVLLDAESGRAVVTDFGIAAAIGNATPSSGIAIGTPQYLSPEQARGEDAEPRSDLYSLGATGWFALTGAPVFTGTLPQLLHRHATETAPPLLTVRPTVPVSLARTIDRCLAKRAADRPSSAEALAAELGQSVALAPVIPARVREYLRAVSGTEVQQYAVAGMLLTAIMFVLNGTPQNQIVDVSRIIATISGFASAASFLVSGTLLAERARQVRELTRAGFDYRAVRRAVEQERARLAAESAPVSRDRAVKIGVAGATIAVGAAMLAIDAQSYLVGFLWATTSMVSGLLTARGVVESGVARGPGVRGRLFQAIERWMFREFAVKNAPRAVTDGEATVVALGGAIQDLWQRLPESARDALSAVPRIAAQLEDEAVHLRASPDPSAAARLQTVVAAMESLRLELLRVQSGAVQPAELTAQIDAARAVGQHVDALLRGQDEVRAVLRPETTPV